MHVTVYKSEVKKVKARKVTGKDAIAIKITARGYIEIELPLSKARKLHRQLEKILKRHYGEDTSQM